MKKLKFFGNKLINKNNWKIGAQLIKEIIIKKKPFGPLISLV